MTRKANGSKNTGFKLITDERLIELYSAMVHFRLVDEQLGGKIERAKTHAHHEAIAAGVLLHLRKDDRVLLAAHRRAYRLLRGERLEHLLSNSELHSHAGLIPIDASSSGAEQVMLAAGVALTLKSARKNTSAVILFVEGNQTAGKEWEAALRFVTAQHLGLIIVCLGATGYKQKKVLEEPGARIAVKGLPPALQVDASDCVAIYRVTQEALTHAREGSRPTVIRALETVALVRAKGAVDPIALMEDYLRSKKLFSRKLQITVFSEFKKKLKLARAR